MFSFHLANTMRYVFLSYDVYEYCVPYPYVHKTNTNNLLGLKFTKKCIYVTLCVNAVCQLLPSVIVTDKLWKHLSRITYRRITVDVLVNFELNLFTIL